MVERLALSLVHAARRLHPYFQNHSITVKTDYPIQKILQKLDLARRMSSWAVEMSEFNIRYEPHGPIKAQCLLDFINDLQHTPTEDQWTLHEDGSSNLKGVSAGIVLEGANDILIEKSLHFVFKTSNNQAEYEAILAGLSLAREVGVKTLTCKTDSKLTVGHLNDEFQIKDPILLQYYHLVRTFIQSVFERVRIERIPRTDNIRADILSKLASTKLKGRHRSMLPQTLWAYRCTPQSTTNESPFSLVYGVDAMIPIEIGEPSLRRELYDPTHNHRPRTKTQRESPDTKLSGQTKSCQEI